MAQKKSGNKYKVAKNGICPPALADEIMDSHYYPNTIYTDLLNAAVTIPGTDALLHWLKFAALGEKDTTSRASALSVTLMVCNEFSSTSALEEVYQGLGEQWRGNKS